MDDLDEIQRGNLDREVLAAAGKIIRVRRAGMGDQYAPSTQLSVGQIRGALSEDWRRKTDMNDLYAAVGRLVEAGHLVVYVNTEG